MSKHKVIHQPCNHELTPHSPDFNIQLHEHWLNYFLRASRPDTLVRMANGAVHKMKDNACAVIAIRVAEDLRECQMVEQGFKREDFDYADLLL